MLDPECSPLVIVRYPYLIVILNVAKVRDIDLSFHFVIMIMANDRFTKKELRRRKGEKIDED
jgi:hypothetical protein